MAEENDVTEVTAEVGSGGVKFGGKSKQMAEIIAMLSAVGTILVGYMLWTHTIDTKDEKKELAQAITKLSEAQTKAAAATREMTCYLVLPQERRESEYRSPFSSCRVTQTQ